MKKLSLFLIATLYTAPAFADVSVQFFEGAPKDRFVITNTDACDLGPATLVINFEGSRAGLIFDVTESGAGVEVFQPFEVITGENLLKKSPVISDGDKRTTLEMKSLAPLDQIAFTIDVDDTNGTREITVADDEIRGAEVSLHLLSNTYSAIIDAHAKVILDTPACAI
jgi:hypothetical protein